MRLSLASVGFLCLLAFSGCSAKTPGGASNSERAKYILVTALESWKSGQTESLITRNPAIRFADEDQKAGMELIDYQFETEAAPIKPFQNVEMVLMLKDSQGETSRKNATYQVGVEPSLTVLRSDH